MFKHWMSKAQNNTSHFDKGAAHCDFFLFNLLLQWRLLLYVQSYHVIRLNTMINICCLLLCGFWNVEWMQIFYSSLGCTLNLVYFFCITCIDDKRWSAARIVSNTDEIFWTDCQHARTCSAVYWSAICSPAHIRYIAKFQIMAGH